MDANHVKELCVNKHVNSFSFQNRDSNIAEEKIRCKVGCASAERTEKAARKRVAERLLRSYEAEGEQF
jgi:hypothetical protein